MTNDKYREEWGDIYVDEYTYKKIYESIETIRQESIDEVNKLKKKKKMKKQK